MQATAARHPSPTDPKREAILRHARRAFVTDGYAGARIEPIARDAGVSTATLYALFDGKAELFTAVIEDAAVDFDRLMRHVRTVGGPARQRLTYFATAYAGFMADPFIRSVFRLVVAERPRFRDVAMQFFDRGKADFGKVLIDALRELVERGELRIERPSCGGPVDGDDRASRLLHAPGHRGRGHARARSGPDRRRRCRDLPRPLRRLMRQG